MKKIFKTISLNANKNKFFLYVIPLVIYINITLIDTTTTFFNESYFIYKALIKYACIAVITIKIIFCDVRQYKKINYIRICVFFLLLVITSLVSTNRAVIQYFFIILGVFKLDFKKVVKYVLIGEALCVIMIILLSIIGLIPNRVFGRSNSSVLRYSLGFQYATYPSLFIWYFTILYLYLRDSKTKIYEYIFLVVLNIIMYKVTDSRNELIFSILIIFISLIYNRIDMCKIKKIINKLAQYSIIVFSILSILLMNLYRPTSITWEKLDSFVSGRLKYSYQCKQRYNIKLFGNKMEWIGLSDIYEGKFDDSEFFYVDNSYLNILFNYGVVSLILVNFAYYYVIKELNKNNENFLISILAIIIMHSFIDPQLVKIAYNIFILLFSNILFKGEQILSIHIRKKETYE